jgi:hypothetical protein
MVELGKKTAYLVLDSEDAVRRKFRVVETLQDVLKNWNSTTRFSPVHPVASQEVVSEPFAGDWNLIFFGTCHPFDFSKYHDLSKALVWFTLGVYNILHATTDKESHAAARRWITEQRIPCEIWHVQDGVVNDVAIIPGNSEDMREVQQEIATFPYEKATSAIRPSLLEYLPLISATLHKSSLFAPQVLGDIQQFHRTVGKSLGDCATDFEALEKLNLLTVVNAGLSHFCSQTFSGTSPISETLCHFWSHSLLGIGIANLAVWKIKSSIETCFWRGAIPERLEAFAQEPPIDIDKPERDDIWKKDYLNSIPDRRLGREEIVRSIAYFSGRDGFRSSRCTVSAPLASVDACNSQKWNLLTMTHELTHILTDGCLAVVCPNPSNWGELDRACRLLRAGENCSHLLESVQRLFLKGVISVYTHFHASQAAGTDTKFTTSPPTVAEAILKSSRLVNEVITHVLDFKYFYESTTTAYVSSVWCSWGVLPKGQRRIQEYLLRTLCAILCNHIGREDELGVVRMELINELTNIAATETENDYVGEALKLLKNDESWRTLNSQVVALLPIVQLASTFLYSEALAAPFSRERAVHSGSDKEGYKLSKLVFERERISNKIRFLLEYATDTVPSSAASMWIMYQLAFSLEDENAT